jgi:hypothetical protein
MGISAPTTADLRARYDHRAIILHEVRQGDGGDRESQRLMLYHVGAIMLL